MSVRSTFLALATILATANAHVKMAQPVPYAADKVDTSPISAAQYPCKAQNGFAVTQMNSMKVGEQQSLKLSGEAIHGGGSCQLSVTTDTEPTANSKFKVIMSLEGNCPKGPNAEYSFKLPDSIPNGKATFAWTWFSRLSGTAELYMNCAPIDVTGGASDSSAFDQLPDLLVANIGEGCTTVPNMNTKFPNPGQNLITDNSLAQAELPTGSCGASGGGNSPGQSPASSAAPGAPSSPASSAPASGPSAPAAEPSAPAAGPSSGAAEPPSGAPTGNPGGVFAPGASSAPQSTLTTLVTVTAAPGSPAQPTAPAAAPSVGAPPAAGTGTPAAPSSPSAGGGSTCSQNGAVVCNGSDQFGLCNNGQVVWQPVAAGTTCANGSIQKRTTYNRQLKGRVARPRVVVPGKDFSEE